MNIELELTTITPGGDAMGRYEGMVVFVPFGLPNERVEVEIIEKRRNFARGRIVRLLEASPDRVSLRCQHFGICGGCQWQQIDYAAQIRFKTDIVREQLIRIGKIENPPVLPCIPSPLPYGYRNHARLAVAPSGRLGYRATSSHSVVEIDECPILEAQLWTQVANAALRGSIYQAPEQKSDVEIRWQTPDIRIGEHSYFVSPGSFFQANTPIAATMVDCVLNALQLRGHEAVLDLYCGVGLFTLPLALRTAKVIGIESNPIATIDAEHNLEEVNRKRPGVAQIITDPVATGLQRAEVMTTDWDAIVLDPPRAGVDEDALQGIIHLNAPRQVPTIIYVSCDPATLARDLHKLVNAGYQLVSAQPFDMFPQTYHVETIVVLHKA